MFKNLNLDRANIEQCLNSFCIENGIQFKNQEKNGGLHIALTKMGQESALIILHLRKDGTTTIQFNQGRNQELGQRCAEYMKAQLCPEEAATLDLVIKGVSQEDFNTVYEEIKNNDIDNKLTYNETPISGGNQYKLFSETYKDSLALSYFPNTNNLRIQGKPLSCYKIVAYALTYILDTDTLGKILYKKDDADSIIARPEMAEAHLKKVLPKSFSYLPQIIRDMLISSQCIKSAAPNLPEYSMLTYVELRALEGIIKEHLSSKGLSPLPQFIGELFDKTGHRPVRFELKAEDTENFNGNKIAVEAAYSYYYERRHALFHMDEFVEASTKIESLTEAINICNKVYKLIEDLY
ncbi:type II toxin-antitoxin system RnlA family toxin [Neisseria weixii]|uniref:type II toxin-antitoxin system RnlA family toxin n=1 Tax=Neisseria weixii TaxID=1853276 RepID=UPI0035A0E6E7